MALGKVLLVWIVVAIRNKSHILLRLQKIGSHNLFLDHQQTENIRFSAGPKKMYLFQPMNNGLLSET